jgi:uncharacterized Zn finger protein
MANIITFDYMSGEYEIDDRLLIQTLDDRIPSERLLIEDIPTIPRKIVSKTWWGERWSSSLERNFHPDVIERARMLARGRSVQRVYVAAGILGGLVVTGPDYYFSYCTPTIHFPTFPLENWERALTTFASQGRRIAALLNGKLPEETTALLTAESIYPFENDGLQINHTCNDGRKPCPHALALAYAFTAMLDSNPMLMFPLYGLWIGRVIALLRGEPYAPPAAETEIAPQRGDPFWLGGALPTVPPLQTVNPDFSRLSPKAGQEFPRFFQKMADIAHKFSSKTPETAPRIEKVALPHTAERPLPSFMERRYEELITEFDRACAEHLTPEFLTPGHEMIRALCVSSLTPMKGRPSHWIAAVIWALEQLNYTTPPHSDETIGEWFKVAAKSVSSKGSAIMTALQMQPHDPRWSFTPESSPWMWMVKVDNVLIDARNLPEAMQREALRQGAITEAQFNALTHDDPSPK